MSETPQVSIGIITYNHGQFITECLDSIRLQTYPNIELVISDDGSKDDTADVIRHYALQYPDFKFRFVAQPQNLGISKNSNFVFDQTDGEYFACFAGDDIMMPQKIERQVKALQNNLQASFCYSDCEWFHSASGRTICNHFGFLQKPPRTIADVVSDFTIPTPTMMVRRSLVPVEKYDERLKYFSDFMMAVRLMQVGEAIFIPDVLVKYRKHSGSIMSQNMCVEDRAILLTLFKDLFGRDPVMEAAMIKYKTIYFYAAIAEAFKNKEYKQGGKLLPKLFPTCLLSVKWFIRDVKLCQVFLQSLVR